jgi:hypothetical protein
MSWHHGGSAPGWDQPPYNSGGTAPGFNNHTGGARPAAATEFGFHHVGQPQLPPTAPAAGAGYHTHHQQPGFQAYPGGAPPPHTGPVGGFEAYGQQHQQPAQRTAGLFDEYGGQPERRQTAPAAAGAAAPSLQLIPPDSPLYQHQPSRGGERGGDEHRRRDERRHEYTDDARGDREPRYGGGGGGGGDRDWDRRPYRGDDDRGGRRGGYDDDARQTGRRRERDEGGGDRRDGEDYDMPSQHCEDLPASFLYCVRQLQEGSYDAISKGKMAKALALRRSSSAHPRPHMLQRYLVEFFVQVNGKHGVKIDDPYSLVPALISEANLRRATQEGALTADTSMAQAVPPQPSAEGVSFTPTLLRSAVTAAPQGSAGSAAGGGPLIHAGDEAALRDLRNRALKQQARSTLQPRPCAHYGSKEGCRRGTSCPFAHAGWDGNPATANGGPPSGPQSAADVFRAHGIRPYQPK